MTRAYVLNNDGSTNVMSSIHCKSEDLELQKPLELNPDLIPGDQINPDNPRRWLVVKREMPVPSPSTGNNRWSIDFFFVDQDAMPTFIECKRYKDTGARRAVVGQMMEYAANGHHYWSKDEMRKYAEESAKTTGKSLEEHLERLHPEELGSIDDFFQRVENNLREGRVRLIFFMEEAPFELKSVVDFLNKQMERSEVLLVEARQYEHNGTKIVTPILFGYTEEARQVKKNAALTTGKRRKWDQTSFFNDAEEKLTEKEVTAIKQLFDKSQELKCELSWGTGSTRGSFSVKWSHLGLFSVYSVYSDGAITINYDWFKTPEEKEFIAFLKENLESNLGLFAPDDYANRMPTYKISDWSNQVNGLLTTLKLIIEKYPIPDSV